MAKITAMSSLAYSHYTLREALPRIAARGFGRVEIATFESYCFHFDPSGASASELKLMFSELGLSPVALNWSPGLAVAYDAGTIDPWVDAFERKIPEAAEAGIPMMTMHFGERNERGDQEAQLATAVGVYDRVADYAARFGVRMVLEVPHLYTIHWSPAAVLWIFDHLSSPNVGALIDSSHWGIIGYDIDEFLGRLGDKVWHIHLRDAKGPDTADRHQELELTPGQGKVDFRKLALALDSVGYNADVSTEFEYRDVSLEEIEHQCDLGLAALVQSGWEVASTVRYSG